MGLLEEHLQAGYSEDVELDLLATKMELSTWLNRPGKKLAWLNKPNKSGLVREKPMWNVFVLWLLEIIRW